MDVVGVVNVAPGPMVYLVLYWAKEQTIGKLINSDLCSCCQGAGHLLYTKVTNANVFDESFYKFFPNQR